MKILHTEASPGWGGQEIRILKEALGMRQRGHEIIFAIQNGGKLIERAQKEGFLVYPVDFSKKKGAITFYKLCRIIQKHQIDVVNTHSSLDAWIGGFAGKWMGCSLIRTRHLSTPIRKGINSYLLYNFLADFVMTTSQEIATLIAKQAKLPPNRIQSIATGIDFSKMHVEKKEIEEFRKKYQIKEGDCLVGTLCILRGWKGISDFLHAAKILSENASLKWMVVGGGVSEDHFLKERSALGLEEKVIFTGHIEEPNIALAAMDLFLLLSWGHEGVSQASLQAAYLKKPLITTSVGGLKEVCHEGVTGLLVPSHSPQKVAEAVLKLQGFPRLCKQYGESGNQLVHEKFGFEKMLDEIEKLYNANSG